MIDSQLCNIFMKLMTILQLGWQLAQKLSKKA